MEWLEAALLGLVQGLTEFLPVSSSGHLVLLGQWLGADEAGVLLEVALHAATLGAVLVFYRARIAAILAGVLGRDADAWRDVGKLVVATLPAVGFALLARDWIERQFESTLTAGIGLLVTGALLWSTRRTLPRAHQETPSWSVAWWMGCAQAMAILPGISRSGATVCAALALGLRPLAAAEFSFLMSTIAISGAVVLQLADLEASAVAWDRIGLGAAVAFVSGLAALALFVRLLRSQSFHRFAIYVWVLGAVAIAVSLR